jgi:hypothetical protein
LLLLRKLRGLLVCLRHAQLHFQRSSLPQPASAPAHCDHARFECGIGQFRLKAIVALIGYEFIRCQLRTLSFTTAANAKITPAKDELERGAK